MQFDPNVLQIRCPHCGGELTVQCAPEDPTVGKQSFTCPYCNRTHAVDFGARVLWVTKGHKPMDRQ